MNKRKLLTEISRSIDYEVSQDDIKKVISGLSRVLLEAWKRDMRISIDGLGSFTPRTRQGRTAKHPLDPTVLYTIPPVKYVKFNLCGDFQKILNGIEVPEKKTKKTKEVDVYDEFYEDEFF